MNESEQKQWIRDNPDYYGESSLGMWELVAELLGFNTEKAEEEIFIAERVNSYEELSEASKCSFLDAMETDHKDYVEKRAPLIFKHIEGVDHGIAMPDTYRRPLIDSHQIASVLKQFSSALKADGLAPKDYTGLTEAFIAQLFASELKKADPEFAAESFIRDIQKSED